MIVRANWPVAAAMTRNILILGGTGEAAELTRRLSAEAISGIQIVTSFAGRTKNPPPLPGRVIRGGFGGIQGLKNFIESEAINLVIDATHPFAATISENAYIACTVTDTLLMTLVRPSWSLPPDGKWLEVDDMAAACAAIRPFAKRVFLTTGTRDLAAFSALSDVRFLVRLIEAPTDPLPLANYQVVCGRPPHDIASEQQLMAEHQIDCLISKHAGGAATVGKIQAALDGGIPVILIRRPVRLPGLWTDSVDECFAWTLRQL